MAVLALPELQQSFTAGLLGGEDTVLLDLIEGDGLDARARLGIYRHHVLTTLTAVLEAVYPVVCALVDRRFFGYAADAFIRRHPPPAPTGGPVPGRARRGLPAVPRRVSALRASSLPARRRAARMGGAPSRHDSAGRRARPRGPARRRSREDGGRHLHPRPLALPS